MGCLLSELERFAGGLGAATGGAAFAAAGGAAGGVGGFVAGAGGGFVGGVTASPVLGIGNAVAFGDSYSIDQLVTDATVGAVIGGVANGIIAKVNGRGFWKGNITSSVEPTLPQPAKIIEATKNNSPEINTDDAIAGKSPNSSSPGVPNATEYTKYNYRQNLIKSTGFDPGRAAMRIMTFLKNIEIFKNLALILMIQDILDGGKLQRIKKMQGI